MTSAVFTPTRVLSIALMVALLSSLLPLPALAAAKARPSVILTAPASKSIFSKTGGGVIPMAWSARNVPENTLVVIELERTKLTDGGGVGGGVWQTEIPAGNSIGSDNWDIEGEGRPGAGKYRARALLQECSAKGCSVNPSFPGEKKTKVYAKSAWKHFTVVKSGRTTTDDTEDASTRGAVSVKLMVNGSESDNAVLSAGSNASVTYFPSGDVDTCTIKAEYSDDTETVQQGWKNAIKQGQYGQAWFGVVGPDGTLESIQVRCKNGKFEATDRITVTTADTGMASFKILTGRTGKQTYKKGTGTEAQARTYCSQAYNDPDIHRGTRVQCYWDGVKFEDVDEFKG